MNATVACPLTNPPMRRMIASVIRETRSRREAGTKRKPTLVTLGSDARKYRVKIRTVRVATAPETNARPTPITPPKAETTYWPL